MSWFELFTEYGREERRGEACETGRYDHGGPLRLVFFQVAVRQTLTTGRLNGCFLRSTTLCSSREAPYTLFFYFHGFAPSFLVCLLCRSLAYRHI